MLKVIFRLFAIGMGGLALMIGMLIWMSRSSAAIPENALELTVEPARIETAAGQPLSITVTIKSLLPDNDVRKSRLTFGRLFRNNFDARSDDDGWRQDRDPWLEIHRFEGDLDLKPGQSVNIRVTLTPRRPGEFEDHVAIDSQIPIRPFGVANRNAAAPLTIIVSESS